MRRRAYTAGWREIDAEETPDEVFGHLVVLGAADAVHEKVTEEEAYES